MPRGSILEEDMRKRERQDRADMRERLCHALDIQPDIFPGGSFVEIRGRNSVTVKGSCRVLTYTDCLIRFSLGKGVLRIEGRRLCCSAYHCGAAVVDGHISLVCFEEEE